METHNIDSKIRALINESADYYDQEADQSKAKIWQQVQQKGRNQSRPWMFRALVAACILLFISTVIVTFSNIRATRQINALVALNSTLQSQLASTNINDSKKQELLTHSKNTTPDTVYVEKKVVLIDPEIKTVQVTDTVYIERTIYIEKEAPNALIAASDNSEPFDATSELLSNSNETQILIRNDSKPKKERKLRISFGGNAQQVNEGTLALTTDL